MHIHFTCLPYRGAAKGGRGGTCALHLGPQKKPVLVPTCIHLSSTPFSTHLSYHFVITYLVLAAESPPHPQALPAGHFPCFPPFTKIPAAPRLPWIRWSKMKFWLTDTAVEGSVDVGDTVVGGDTGVAGAGRDVHFTDVTRVPRRTDALKMSLRSLVLQPASGWCTWSLGKLAVTSLSGARLNGIDIEVSGKHTVSVSNFQNIKRPTIWSFIFTVIPGYLDNSSIEFSIQGLQFFFSKYNQWF